MKCKLTVLLLLSFVLSEAQWSNTNNQFYDSLQSFVCKDLKNQGPSISLRSYPDSGYIIIWEDARGGVNNLDIYAQKYDKNGVVLWATDGVPIATGPDVQTFSRLGEDANDYRKSGHACTDSAGGFYMAWEDFNMAITGVNGASRVCVQHTKSDGTNVFPGIGKILAEPEPGRNYQFKTPQLIADGNKGFYVGYIEADNLEVIFRNLYVKCFREEAGILKYFGGGKMDPDKVPVLENAFPCGTLTLRDNIADIDDRVQHFNIFPDGNNGCGVVWTFSRNAAAPNGGKFLVSNRLCRVKKNSHTTCKRQLYSVVYNGTNLTSDGTAIVETTYPKDSVVLLYQFSPYKEEHYYICTNGDAGVLTHRRYQIFGEGYQIIESSNWLPTLNAWNFPKGLIIPTNGNVDPIVYAINQHEFGGGTITKAYIYETVEKYDSLPYQLTSDSVYIGYAFNNHAPTYLNKISNYIDTILVAADNQHDFSIAAGNGRMLVTALKKYPSLISPDAIFLQEIKVDRKTADSFHIHINTLSKKGVLVAKGASTGFTGSDIAFEFPMVTMDKRGNALFYVAEVGRYVRVSPIEDSAKLLWGTGGGKPIGSALNHMRPFVTMNNDGTALLCWHDNRSIYTPPYTENDILMRHLDSLDSYSYTLPFKKLYTLDNGIKQAFPIVMVGNSDQWISFDMKNNANNWTEVVQVKDNFNLGFTYAQAFTNKNIYNPGIRTYNGKPYLDINYLINPTNNPAGTASVGVRLFFTQEEFNALKLADPSIISPADLVVIKQPGTNNAPDAYLPIAGEETIVPSRWKAVDGGYYLELNVTSFSNFFIFRNTSVLPLTWLNATATAVDATHAKLQWEVADPINVLLYVAEHSTDGIHFTPVCNVVATNDLKYQCIAPAIVGKTNFYRIQQKDKNGAFTYSRIMRLNSGEKQLLVKLYPNPASSILTIESIDQMGEIRMYDHLGKLCWQRNANSKKIEVAVSQLSKGIYEVAIQDATGKTHFEKLVIQ